MLLEQFLEEWGFRSSAELMLTVPSLQEDPLPAIELLKQYAATDGESSTTAMARQAAERRGDFARCSGQLLRRAPAKAAAVWLLVRWTQRAIAYRERARLKQALLYTRCRSIALAIGKRAVDAGLLRRQDDIFMLSCQEIDELGSGRAMFPYRVPEMVDLRLREQGCWPQCIRPTPFDLPESEYLPHESDAAAAPDDVRFDEDDNASTMRGIGACGGRARRALRS